MQNFIIKLTDVFYQATIGCNTNIINMATSVALVDENPHKQKTISHLKRNNNVLDNTLTVL